LGKRPSLRFIIPFLNTPSNILTFTFERTPLAPVTSRFRNAIAEGGAKADIAMARMAVGTLAIMWAIDMGMKGQITGGGPTSTAERQLWRRMGHQPYSKKIGDKWVAYNRMDPIGFTIGIGGDAAEFILNAEADDELAAEIQEGMAAAVFSIAENASSKSYLQGLSRLMAAVNEPDRYGPSYIEMFASSFIPSGVGEIARQMDPKMRVSHDIWSAMKRRIPGYSDDLPPRLDLWGREISYESGLGRLYDTVSPLYVSRHDPQPIDEAMVRDGWTVGMPSKNLTVDGESVGLKNRPEIYARYVKLQGGTKPSQMGIHGDGLVEAFDDKTLMEVLNDVVTGEAGDISDAYNASEDPDDKRDVISKIVNVYRRVAREQVIEEFPELLEASARKRIIRLRAASERAEKFSGSGTELMAPETGGNFGGSGATLSQ
jgi:hypothetical protein